jgi:hypothetical protein
MFAKMPSSRGVMAGLDDVATELFIIRDIEFSLIIDESVLLFPFKKAIKKLTRFFGFKRLECLSYRRLTIQAVLDVLFKQWHRKFDRAEIKCCSSKLMKMFGEQYNLVIVVFSIRNLVA